MQQRVARSDATATSLLNGVAMRRQALLLLEAGQPLRDTVAQAKLEKASASFVETATTRLAALEDASEPSAKLKLPYLARRYDQLTALVQLEPLCAPSSSSWREAGCVALRPKLGAAKTALTTTLPAQLKAGLDAMRDRGVDAALLDAAQRRLDAGELKAAAALYDAALRAAEGT